MQVRRRAPAVARIVIALVVALCATAGGLAASEAPSGALPGFTITRLSGGDRYATAARIATETFTSAGHAVVASGEDFPDALAGNYLAGRRGAPVLLTGRTSLPTPTRQALQQLGVDRVTLLGGEGAIGAAVASTLAGLDITVDRVAGADRFVTAAAVAGAGGAPPSGTALLASGRSFADALAAGPIAYGSALPQLLTEAGDLPRITADALRGLGIHTVIILGGPSVVGPAVEAELNGLGMSVARLAGPNRYATGVAIADWAVGALGHQRAHVDVATGTNFPDALAGGAHAGRVRSTVLLVEPSAAGGAAAQYLSTHAAAVVGGHAFGGASAISEASIDALEAAGRGVPPPAPGNVCETTLLGLVNGERTARGLAPYLTSTAATPIARNWSAGMAANGGLSHNANLPNDLRAAGINWTAWAENVSFGSSPAAVHGVFMGSAVHRGNILSPELTHIAIGCTVDGAGVHWVTEIFYRT